MIFLIKPMAFAEEQCDKAERADALESARIFQGAIARRFKSEDVEPFVSLLKFVLRKCNISNHPEFRSLKEEDYQLWLKTGWLAEAEKWKKKAIYATNFRYPLGDIKNYTEFARKGGVKLKEILYTSNILLKSTHRKGLLSEKRERKNCTAVDFRSKLGPVRDQGDSSWCYAFSAADLLSYKYKTNQPVSALGVALSYHKAEALYQKNKGGDDIVSSSCRGDKVPTDAVDAQCKFVPTSQIRGGSIIAALEEALKSGFCLEKNLASEGNDEWHIIKTLSIIEEAKAHQDTLESKDLCDNVFPSVMALFPNISYTEFLDVFETSMRTSLIDNLAMKSCNKHFLSDSKKLKAIFDLTVKERAMAIFDKIDAQFGKDNIASIRYDSRVLRDKNFGAGKGFVSDLDDDSFRLHASPLVGRRYNEATKSCEYLVRNSWGRSCQPYDESYDCEEGHIWIPKETLSRRLVGVDYLE